MNPLLKLSEYGQSYWIDDLSRPIIESGELERRVRDEGLRGVTSNPTIFQKAMAEGDVYDAQIRELAVAGRSAAEIYETVTTTDIRKACDILRPVFDGTGGEDGYVSLEVSPHLAHDTEASIEEAERLARIVDRPNLLIKIPGTPAGVLAVERLLSEGINVNITLLFSIDAYQAVADAYLRAQQKRESEGRPLGGIASVASFFLSRIDVLVDQLLTHRIPPGHSSEQSRLAERLRGKAAVANAKLAYRRFRENLASDRWQELERKGARPQRMLWASTSTKTPGYSDLIYVEPLIGPMTVNTMPDQTIAAFADHGRVAHTVEEGMEDAVQVMSDLERIGIDFRLVTTQLVNEGIQKFVDPYDQSLQALERKRELYAQKT
jgi:transaldolase